jgi:ribosomal protein S18 acetylase RimI-like enzyme
VIGSVEIRIAAPDDAHAIAVVHVESWRVGYRGLLGAEVLATLSVADRERAWRRRLVEQEAMGRRVAVAVDGGSVVGFVASGPSREDEAEAATGEIYAIYVHPDHWSRGAGRALMRSAVNHLAVAGSTEAFLWVLAGNKRAKRFYELAGWSWDGRTRIKNVAEAPDFVADIEEARYRRAVSPDP